MRNNFVTRTLVALPLLVCFILFLVFQGWYYRIFLSILLIIAQYEIIKVIKTKVENLNVVIPYITACLVPIIAYFFGAVYIVWIYVFAIFTLILELILNQKRDINSFVYNIFSLIYPSMLFAFIFAMNINASSGDGRLMFILAFFTAIVTDTFAYLFGSAFGKRKLCPNISPKKSVEGAVAGYVFGFLSIVLIGFFAQKLIGSTIEIIHFIILGAILPILVQFGDLFASLIKRFFGVKDYGNLFPGHGGILDRMDSSLFVCPIVYLYFDFLVF